MLRLPIFEVFMVYSVLPRRTLRGGLSLLLVKIASLISPARMAANGFVRCRWSHWVADASGRLEAKQR